MCGSLESGSTDLVNIFNFCYGHDRPTVFPGRFHRHLADTVTRAYRLSNHGTTKKPKPSKTHSESLSRHTRAQTEYIYTYTHDDERHIHKSGGGGSGGAGNGEVAEGGAGLLDAGEPEEHGDGGAADGAGGAPAAGHGAAVRVRGQVPARRVPAGRVLQARAVRVARAAELGQLRDVHADDRGRDARRRAAGRRVRRARHVGHAGQGRFGRQARAGGAAAHGSGGAQGAGHGRGRLDGRGARAQDADQDDPGAGPGGQRDGAVLPAAAGARRPVHLRPAAARRRLLRRRERERLVPPGRAVRRDAGHVGAHRRPVRLRQHQVRDTHVRRPDDPEPRRPLRQAHTRAHHRQRLHDQVAPNPAPSPNPPPLRPRNIPRRVRIFAKPHLFLILRVSHGFVHFHTVHISTKR